jgi:hypothetical protein
VMMMLAGLTLQCRRRSLECKKCSASTIYNNTIATQRMPNLQVLLST